MPNSAGVNRDQDRKRSIANMLKYWGSLQGYSPVVLKTIRLLCQEIGNFEPLNRSRRVGAVHPPLTIER
jgi:hypothetical protein